MSQRIDNAIHVTVALDHVRNGRDVVILVRSSLLQGPRTLQGPSDEVEASLLRSLRVRRGDNFAAVRSVKQSEDGRRQGAHALLVQLLHVTDSRLVALFRVDARVEVDGLLSEAGFGLDPVQDVILEERLRPYARGADAGLLVLVNELLGVGFLGVVALEGHLDLGGLELWSELQAQALGDFDVCLVVQGGSAVIVYFCTPAGAAVLVFLGGSGIRVGRVHLGAEREEFVVGDVGGAAFGCRLGVLCRGLERRSAFLRKLRDQEDIGGGVQVALRVAAHELTVAGECDVALQDASAHARTGIESLASVLGELERATAVGDGEERRVADGLLSARLELLLERALVHLVDEPERSRTDLDVGHRRRLLRLGSWGSDGNAGGDKEREGMHCCHFDPIFLGIEHN